MTAREDRARPIDDRADPVAAPTAVTPVVARESSIALFSPAAPNVVATTGEIVVVGSVAPGIGHVQVLLQTAAASPIVVETVKPLVAEASDGRIRASTFVATLALPDPRPSGRAVIQVVSYDARGRARDFVLRPILIGALAPRPVVGDDGLLGGIVVRSAAHDLVDRGADIP